MPTIEKDGLLQSKKPSFNLVASVINEGADNPSITQKPA